MRPATVLLLLVVWALPRLPASAHASASGILGVYADQLQGAATASGAPYDRAKRTAAHPSLPFGTIVRVENLETRRKVDVVVNDRKPKDGRLLVVLSGAAAEAIGLGGKATASGSLQVLKTPAAGSAPLTRPSGGEETRAPRRFAPFAAWLGKSQAKDSEAYPSAFPAASYGSAPALASGRAVTSKAQSAPDRSRSHPAGAPVSSQVLPPASPQAPYRVQFGAFRRLSSADKLSGMLRGGGIPTSVFSSAGALNVVVTDAGFRSAEEAQRWIDFEGARRGWTDRPVVIR